MHIYDNLIKNDRPYPGKLNPQQILEKCDSFVTSEVITLCIQEFNSPILSRRLHILHIFDELIKWGDIEAAHVINCTDFIDDSAR